MKNLLFNIMFSTSIMLSVNLNSQSLRTIDLVEGEYFAKDTKSDIGITFDSIKKDNYPFDGRKLIFTDQNGYGLMSLNYDMNLLYQKNGTFWVTNENNQILETNYGVNSWAYGESRNVAGWFLSPIDDKGSAALQVTGDATISGSLYFPSDRSLKQNINDVPSVMDKLMALSPKSYTYRQDSKKQFTLRNILPTGPQIGLIAQELASVYPHLVTTKYSTITDHNNVIKQEESYQAVNYVGMIPILIKAIQEQQMMLEESLDRMEYLQDEIDELRTGQEIDQSMDNKRLYPSAIHLGAIYPNPSRGLSNVEIYVPKVYRHARIEIIDAIGNPVYTEKLQIGTINTVNIDTTIFVPGPYFYYVLADHAKSPVRSLVIQD